VTEIEGKMDEEDIEDELGHAFKSLLLDTKDVKDFEQFFTSIGGLLTVPFILTETTSTFMNDLNSLSLIYRLISKNLTLRLNESLIKDVHTFTVKGSSRYDSYHFYGIIINISASRYLITGLD
jgi:hypothetical protein